MTLPGVPAGFGTVTPHLTVRNCESTVRFYEAAFGAVAESIKHGPDGRVMHAVIEIGGSRLMLHDEYPEMGVLSPASTGQATVFLNIYTADAQAAWDRAVAAGAEVVFPLGQQFWGALYGQVKDPSGHVWEISEQRAA